MTHTLPLSTAASNRLPQPLLSRTPACSRSATARRRAARRALRRAAAAATTTTSTSRAERRRASPSRRRAAASSQTRAGRARDSRAARTTARCRGRSPKSSARHAARRRTTTAGTRTGRRRAAPHRRGARRRRTSDRPFASGIQWGLKRDAGARNAARNIVPMIPPAEVNFFLGHTGAGKNKCKNLLSRFCKTSCWMCYGRLPMRKRSGRVYGKSHSPSQCERRLQIGPD